MQFRCHKMLCYVILCYVMLCYVYMEGGRSQKADHPSAIRLATSRLLGERSEACLAAKRPTASDEVARGRPAPHEIRRRTFLSFFESLQRHMFSVFSLHAMGCTCPQRQDLPSTRIFLAERQEDPSTRRILAPCKLLSLGRSQYQGQTRQKCRRVVHWLIT